MQAVLPQAVLASSSSRLADPSEASCHHQFEQISAASFTSRFGVGARAIAGQEIPGKTWQRRLFRGSRMSVSDAQMDHSSECSSRDVTIVNAAGEKLSGIIDDTNSAELVVLCHGLRSTKRDRSLRGIAAGLVKSGTSAFRFDFAGNGESEGQFSYGNYWREADDLHSVILHWRGEGRQISAIVGHSKGGDVVLLYASKYGDVSTVINISGRFALERGSEARFGEEGMKKLEKEGFCDVKNKAGIVLYRVTREGLRDRLATDMDAAVCAISKAIRVLTIHGSVDEVVPVEDAYEFSKRIPNHVLKIIQGGDHNYDGTLAEVVPLVIDFLPGKASKM